MAIRRTIDARPKQPPSLAQLKTPLENLEKQFTMAAAGFTKVAADLAGGASSATAADLDVRLDEVRRVADLIDKIDRLPAVIETLNSFKPKTTVETMAVRKAVTAGSIVNDNQRIAAAKALDQFFELARAVNDMSRLSLAEVPAALERRWTGGKLASVDARWRETVADLAASLASGADLDPAKLARLPQALALYDSLKQAIGMDVTLATSGAALARWVDWHLTLEELKPVLVAYPDAMAEAFAGYASGLSGWEIKWNTMSRRYRPMAALIARLGAYREQCLTFPTGVGALGAGLMVPMDGAPYSQERFFAFSIALWKIQMAEGSALDAAATLDALARRLE